MFRHFATSYINTWPENTISYKYVNIQLHMLHQVEVFIQTFFRHETMVLTA